jgi:hypothetical protein
VNQQAILQQAARLHREAEKRKKAIQSLDYSTLCFAPQRAFVEDPAQLVAACCSRRAGKTFGIMAKAVKTAHKFPGCTVFYVTNTRRQAERGFWNQGLLPFLRETGIQAKLNQNELTCTFTNGSRILLGGANDAQEIENYRGTKTPLVILDEAQSFRPLLRYLIDEIFLPQTADYGTEGQIVMTGTPNAFAVGYFYEALHDLEDAKGWSKHGWTFFENPHMKDPREWLKRYMAQKGLTEESPKILREYFGQWVRDGEGLVYPQMQRCVITEMPDLTGWSFVLGMDLGYVDATAFVILAYNPRLAQIVVVESHQEQHMIPDRVAAHVEALMGEYDFEAIVADAGGLGKPYVETMIQKYGIPVEAAQKTQKLAAIEHLGGDLSAGVLKVFRWGNEELLHDASLYSWNFGKIDKAKFGGMRLRADVAIDDRTPDHLLDGMLYAHRKCMAYLNTGERDGPTRGSLEWQAQQEDELWDQIRESDEDREAWDLRSELLVDEALF